MHTTKLATNWIAWLSLLNKWREAALYLFCIVTCIGQIYIWTFSNVRIRLTLGIFLFTKHVASKQCCMSCRNLGCSESTYKPKCMCPETDQAFPEEDRKYKRWVMTVFASFMTHSHYLTCEDIFCTLHQCSAGNIDSPTSWVASWTTT